MSTFQYIKIGILSAAVLIFLIRKLPKKKLAQPMANPDDIDTPSFFYSIYDGNQDDIIYAPPYDKEWFEALDKKYSTDTFDEYDNRFWEYMYGLFDTLYDISGNDEEEATFFSKLNRPQKIFCSFLMFNGDVDNGGVTQFFFNKPQFAFAVLETFEELQLTTLKNDYEQCLNEFTGTSESYLKRKELFNDTSVNWENRWKAFTDDYADIPSASVLEDYYYDTEFKKTLFSTFTSYIDTHIDSFVKK